VWRADLPPLHLLDMCTACCTACCTAEERFELDGQCGVLTYLKGLLERNGHAVICVAEGAGQDLMHPGESMSISSY
jgi:6-phosphofructokinase 1